MSSLELPLTKLYYSIGEVSELTSVEKYVLRYWETEFPQLRPAKNRAGNRVYRLSDIRLIFLIKKLLYVDKYTIEGARQKLKQIKRASALSPEPTFEDLMRSQRLLEVRQSVYEILQTLEGETTETTTQGSSKKDGPP